MRVLALITARGGSKRIPRKNVRLLGGRPLILWSIDVAMGIPEICDILVSTDDVAIAEIARNAGAMVPWLRPAELATDTATSVDVALHALEWYEKERGSVDGLLLLQPTSPFRTRETIMHGITLFQEHGYRPVVGISPASSHPMWCFKLEENAMSPFIDNGGLHLRSQDLPSAFVVNGALYLLAPEDLRKAKSFHRGDMVPLVLGDPKEFIDIDSEWDWNMAVAALAVGEGEAR